MFDIDLAPGASSQNLDALLLLMSAAAIRTEVFVCSVRPLLFIIGNLLEARLYLQEPKMSLYVM